MWELMGLLVHLKYIKQLLCVCEGSLWKIKWDRCLKVFHFLISCVVIISVTTVGSLINHPSLPLQKRVKNRSRMLLFLSVYVKSCIQYLITFVIVHAAVTMKKSARAIFTVVLIVSQLCSVLTLESTGPAFMWSPHIEMYESCFTCLCLFF